MAKSRDEKRAEGDKALANIGRVFVEKTTPAERQALARELKRLASE
ncbi:hypothetical protein AB0B48_24485 [Micromonospora sp. NPDC049089]